MTTPMANDHPFQQLFENLGNIPTFHAESVNRRAFEVLVATLAVPLEQSGRCIMLRAPRAGHGKTHLLTRIQRQLADTHEFIVLQAPFGCRIDAASVLKDTLRGMARLLPASGGLCGMDLVARKLFAHALQPLVKSGEVPCQDREGALTALRQRPVETFDFHHPNAVTAHWTRDNFAVLGQRLGLQLASSSGMPVPEVAYWVDLLFRFSSARLENPVRMEIMAEAGHAGAGEEVEHLQTLLGLLSLLKRVVLVADDLELFSTDENAGLRLVAFVGAIRQAVERVDVILSLNLDIWQNAFVPRLSGGMADRLAEVVIELEPLREDEMAALLDSRVPGLGRRVLERIDPNASGGHARGLLRAAGIEWLKATAMDAAPPVAASVPVDPPAIEVALPAQPPDPPAAAAVLPEVVPAALPVPELKPARTIVPAAVSTESLWTPLEPVPPVQQPAVVPEAPGVEPTPAPAPVAPSLEAGPPAVNPPLTPTAGPLPASSESTANEAPPEVPESNRVDELLRQFRERYGRGSL